MMRRTTLFLLGAAAGAFAVALVVQPKLLLGQTARAAVSETYRQLNLFGDIFEHVRAQYVEKPNDAKLIESAINGMLNALDPHSAFLDIKNFRDMQTQTRGEFGGLGIEVTMEEGLVKVISPMDGTPAARAGIQPNDLITHLNDEQVKGLTLEQAVDKMRGPVNSAITLRVQRKGADKPIEVKIVREVISIRNVRHRIEGGDIGYIRITSFQGERTIEQLRSSIAEIAKEIPADKLKGYIVDLRNNGGGLLDQAIAVTDAFLERGEIVSTRGRNLEDTQRSQRAAGRSHRRQAADRADQRRFGFGLRDRGRRVAGPQACDAPGLAFVRQGLGADRDSDRHLRRLEAHHRPLLHALRPLDPGQGDHA